MQLEAAKNKSVLFGRIGWSEAGHQKWTHSSVTTNRFLQTEIWAPSRGICQRDGQPPDFLFVLSNEGHWAQDALTFRDTILLAIPSADTSRTHSAAVASIEIAKLAKAKFHGTQLRPWGLPFGKSMYTDSLGGMPTTGLFRIGPVHTQTPGNEILQQHWREC